MPAPEFQDDLARQLWEARRDARAIGRSERVDVTRGERVSAELYAALRGAGAAHIGWKLALTDPEAQARFGTDQPFSAPVFDSSILAAPLLRRPALVAPLLEAEIAIVVDASGRHPAACIEVADCRFKDWRISVGEGLADFGLQGAMLLGTPRAGVRAVDVVARHDGAEVARATKPVEAALKQVRWLEGRLGGALSLGGRSFVATGSLIKPLPLTTGRWEIDFGWLGVLHLEVTP